MAPKVVVPADFGIENLNCEFHNNVVFKLEGEEEIKANSLILSFHSSEFVRLFMELNQSVLEMDDFSKDSVKSFLEALYSGEIQLDRNLFRDVNKMCHVFKVDWLSRRCGEYYQGLVEDVRPFTDYYTLLFLFEEARFSFKVMKSDRMLDVVVQKICNLENRAEIFVEPYMKNHRELGSDQLDLMLQICKSKPAAFLRIMMQNIAEKKIAAYSQIYYSLCQMNLSSAISEDFDTFEAFFDLILNEKNSSNIEEHKAYTRVYRNAVKDFMSKGKGVCFSNRSLSLSTAIRKPAVLFRQDVPNLFCSFDGFVQALDLREYIQIAGSSASNFYIFLEGFLYFCFHKDFTILYDRSIIEEILRIKELRSWNKINADFLHGWKMTKSKNIIDQLFKTQEIVDASHTIGILLGEVVSSSKIYCRMPLTARTLFFSEKFFIFRLPLIRSCSKGGSCGIMLKILPIPLSENRRKLNVQYCMNDSEYPSGYHCHINNIKANDIHVMLMGSFVDLDEDDNFSLLGGALAWNDKGLQIIENDPSNDANHKVQLGMWKFWMDSPLQLGIFIDGIGKLIKRISV